MDKPKCSKCNQRDATHKGLCSGCYAKSWREQRKSERHGEDANAIEGEVSTALSTVPVTHLTATDSAGMEAARGDMKTWLEQKLSMLEHDIVEANAALNEARRNGWSTTALTSARNRAVDDETFYYKILMAVEAGHTIIPDFPISIFAVRRDEPDKREQATYNNVVNGDNTYLARPVQTDCAPAGAGEYRDPKPELIDTVRENRAPGAEKRGEPHWYTTVRRTGYPATLVTFPIGSARSSVMKATSDAMAEKTFDQIGICHPVATVGSTRQVQVNANRAGDPLIIGQVVRKRIGNSQKVVSFIIAWHLDLRTL